MAEKPIHLAFLMWFKTGQQEAGAAALAVERVNADKALLPGRGLEYSWADSGCSARQGLAAIGKLLGEARRVNAVIGPACSSVCDLTSYLAAGQDIPQISYSCTSPVLSNKTKYALVTPSLSLGPILGLRPGMVWDLYSGR